MSSVSPTDKMLQALADPSLLEQRNLLMYDRNGSRRVIKMVSPVLYCSPSGLKMSNAATLYFKVSAAEVLQNPNVTRSNASLDAATYRWDVGADKWIKKSDEVHLEHGFLNFQLKNDELLEFQTESFSSYVVLAPFLEAVEVEPSWWLIESLGLSREQWTFFILLPAAVILCCCVRACIVWRKRGQAGKKPAAVNAVAMFEFHAIAP